MTKNHEAPERYQYEERIWGPAFLLKLLLFSCSIIFLAVLKKDSFDRLLPIYIGGFFIGAVLYFILFGSSWIGVTISNIQGRTGFSPRLKFDYRTIESIEHINVSRKQAYLSFNTRNASNANVIAASIGPGIRANIYGGGSCIIRTNHAEKVLKLIQENYPNIVIKV